MYIMKTDADGNPEWTVIEASANNNNDWARDVVQTDDGNYVVTGTWNDDGWNSKAALRKYNSSGELMWAYNYSSSVANEAYEILETDEGDLVFAGYSGTQHGAYIFFVVKTKITTHIRQQKVTCIQPRRYQQIIIFFSTYLLF